MKSKVKRTTFGLAGLTLAVVLVPAALVAQTPTPAAQQPQGTMMGGQQGGMMGGQGGMMPDCQAMRTQLQETKGKLDAMDVSLDKLVAEMNAAKGSKKVDAMAAVISELVSQRKAARGMMMQMQPAMMAHMMRHMQMGMMQGAAASMADCPMMKMMGAPQGEATQPQGQEHQMHHQK